MKDDEGMKFSRQNLAAFCVKVGGKCGDSLFTCILFLQISVQSCGVVRNQDGDEPHVRHLREDRLWSTASASCQNTFSQSNKRQMDLTIRRMERERERNQKNDTTWQECFDGHFGRMRTWSSNLGMILAQVVACCHCSCCHVLSPCDICICSNKDGETLVDDMSLERTNGSDVSAGCAMHGRWNVLKMLRKLAGYIIMGDSLNIDFGNWIYLLGQDFGLTSQSFSCAMSTFSLLKNVFLQNSV